jgi:hypothetical protein
MDAEVPAHALDATVLDENMSAAPAGKVRTLRGDSLSHHWLAGRSFQNVYDL